MNTPNEPETYSVQQAAERLGVSPADVESYVEEGLVEPARGPAGQRSFSRAQMRRLWTVVTLHRDLGVNLPGVGAVLQLREQFEQMRRDLATLVEIVERELGADVWDRLWPEGRPRPGVNISIEGIAEPGAPEGGETQQHEAPEPEKRE